MLSSASLANLKNCTRVAALSLESFSSNDHPIANQQVTSLLDAWIRVHSEAVTNEKALTQYVYLQLVQQFVLGKTEEQTERFFHLSTQIVVDAVMKTSANGGDGKSLNYTVIDIIYSHLIPLLLRSLNDGDTEEHLATQRIALLNKAVGGIVRCTMWDYESKKNDKSGAWDQRPWFRLLLNLTVDMNYYEAWNPWLFRHSFPWHPTTCGSWVCFFLARVGVAQFLLAKSPAVGRTKGIQCRSPAAR